MTDKCPICDKPLDRDNECVSDKDNHRYVAYATIGGGDYYRYGDIYNGYFIDLRPYVYEMGVKPMGGNGALRIDINPSDIDFDPKNPQPLIEKINLLKTLT